MAGKPTQRKARKIPTLRQHKVEIFRRGPSPEPEVVVHSSDKSELSRFRALPFGSVGG
jgi:hypothetical protein